MAAMRAVLLSKSRPARFFATGEPAGRKIVCGFSYLQRIRKPAAIDLWFPDSIKQAVAERVLAGDTSVLDEFKVEWAAVRQFELLQEADNLSIWDMRVENPNKTFYYLIKMRGGGYRVTVITLGRYAEVGETDELQILDVRLQDEITRLIHMLYLEEQSAEMTGSCAEALRKGTWDYTHELPHVAVTLGSMRMFSRQRVFNEEGEDCGENKESGKKKGGGDAWGAKGFARKVSQEKLSQHFFHILGLLPQRHVVHDVAVGLTLPEASKQKNWVYIAEEGCTYHEFQQAMANAFRAFDHISLDALSERPGKTRDEMPLMHHMSGYGDRLNADSENYYRGMASQMREMGMHGLN
jgi:hypothetical protein